MKKIFFIIIVILFWYDTSLAQAEIIEVSISRKDYSCFYVIDSNKDSILLTKEGQHTVLKNDQFYKIIKGKGKKKDVYGTRERNKRYLVSSSEDTLATLSENNKKIEFKDSTSLYRELTPEGWKYTNTANKTLCEIELYWNNSTWKYTLKYYDSSENIETLKKVNLLSMVNMAYNRSNCDCKKNENENLWLMMLLLYATS